MDRVHDKIREEDRMRKEFVNVISDKSKDIATPKKLDMKKMIREPMFNREQGENLETNIFTPVGLV